MAAKILFTCPVCGGHELMLIQRAVHRDLISLLKTEDGKWVIKRDGPGQELTGEVSGYRCSSCRYPDVPNHDDSEGFYWQTLEHVEAAGVLTQCGDAS